MQAVSIISTIAVPLFICIVVIHGMIRRVPVYDAFISGARSGIGTAFRVMPFIVGMIFAVDIFKASGCFDYIADFLRPALEGIGVPPEVLPLALMRPFSGGASTGMLAGIFAQYGPDSFPARVASTLMGSSETLFYTVSLYYGNVGVTKTRYTVPVGILLEIVGLAASCIVCNLVF